MKKIILALIFLIPAALLAEPSTTAKKYPPYPDVLGYELAWPDKNSRDSQMTVYRMSNGDYVATYIKHAFQGKRADGSCCDSTDLKLDFAALSFFSQEWIAAGFKDTELGVWMKPEVNHGATEVYTGVQV